MKYKNCPSCGAQPLQLKCPGVRYDHAQNCEMGFVTRKYVGTLSHERDERRNVCTKCNAYFTLKTYDNPGDSHTKECPICWATLEASNK